jgi:glycosyltransferase involved in cell wall biosynthesis
MHIIHVGKFYPPFRGGMESYLMDLAQAQVEQGHQVTVIVHNHHWQRLFSKTNIQTINGVKVIRLRTLRPILHAPLMFGLNRCLNQEMSYQSPNLIHLHSPNPSLFWLLVNKDAKSIPWVLSWHSDMVTQHSSKLLKLVYWLIKPFENKLIKNSNSLLVSSQNYADYSPQLSSNKAKTTVIPLGINADGIGQWSKKSNGSKNYWQKGPFKLFSLGRLTFYKNQQMLIDAMQQLPDCQMVLAGDGQLTSALQQQVNSLRLTDRVQLVGSVSWHQAHQLFSSCDVFCLASHDRAESFGVVLLEAMYHNKIILVADTAGSGMKWLAEHYNKGFTFKANDVVDFVEKIKFIKLNQQEIMARPSQFDYHIDAIAKSIEKHYRSIINSL